MDHKSNQHGINRRKFLTGAVARADVEKAVGGKLAGEVRSAPPHGQRKNIK